MDKDIEYFTKSIGANDLREIEELRTLFKRSNYYWLNGNIVVVKISRSKKPFWGVKQDIIERLNKLEGIGFFLALLTSPKEGFLFDKNNVNICIRSEKWGLASDDNYKINWPLPMRNGFSNPDQALKRIVGA